jgi:outer membrane protein OmpU
MKKVLFATSALVASTGFAAADVSLSGYAEMGIVGGNSTETQFHQDIELTFGMSGTTDNGLTFGASIQLDEAAWSDDSDDGGTAVFISGSMGTLTLGDTDGAMDWAMTEAGNMGNGGSIADNETDHGGYLGSYLDGSEDNQVLRYNHSVGDLGIAVSMEADQNGARDLGELDYSASYATGAWVFTRTISGIRNAFTSAGASYTGGTAAADDIDTTSIVAARDSGDSNVALGLTYGIDVAGGSLTLGMGYQSAPDRVVYISSRTDAGGNNDEPDGITLSSADTTAMGVSAVLALDSGLTLGVALTEYSDYAGINAAVVDGTGEAADVTTTGSLTDATHIGVGVGYSMGALTLHANYTELDYDSNVLTDVDGWGASVAYDLGGGAGIHLGVNDNDTGANWSLGLAMSF